MSATAQPTVISSPTLDLAKALIACRSLTPDDAGCQEILSENLRRLGFTIQRMRFGDVDNLWARRGDMAPLICFVGHTDVVPSGPVEQWRSDPFVPTERNGQLYGRGAADMKSSVAAFITGIERFIARHPRHLGSLALLITSDEEGAALNGTAKVVQALTARDEQIDYCIVGEPSSVERLGDTIKNGRRGSLEGKLVIEGVQGHVAYPRLDANPIHMAAPAIADLAEVVWDEGNEFFPPTTWQISNIHAGTGAGNVIPGTLEILFNFRFSTASTPLSLQQRVYAILDNRQLQYEIDWDLSAQPYFTPPGKLVDAMREAILRTTGVLAAVSTTGGTSDGRFIAAVCPQVVEFGPLNESIHKLDEHVAISDLEPLAEIYCAALECLLTK